MEFTTVCKATNARTSISAIAVSAKTLRTDQGNLIEYPPPASLEMVSLHVEEPDKFDATDPHTWGAYLVKEESKLLHLRLEIERRFKLPAQAPSWKERDHANRINDIMAWCKEHAAPKTWWLNTYSTGLIMRFLWDLAELCLPSGTDNSAFKKVREEQCAPVEKSVITKAMEAVTAAKPRASTTYPQRTSTTTTGAKAKTCHNCGREGHIQYNCKFPKTGNASKATAPPPSSTPATSETRREWYQRGTDGHEPRSATTPHSKRHS